MEDARIGFYRSCVSDSRFMGAVLVTNSYGVPVEFKFTEPIVPSKTQRMVYGRVLERFLREDVIRNRLFGEVTQGPSLFVLAPEEFESYQGSGPPEVVALRREDGTRLKAAGLLSRIDEREILLQLAAGEDAARLSFGKMDRRLQEKVVHFMLHLSRSMDLLEPMERLDRALQNLVGESFHLP
ncbi:MAG TPA: hypothetical protein VGB99_17900 [Acidobacteriota bacterium]